MTAIKLIGFTPSVYSRAIRIALAELGIDYNWCEVDPFTLDGQEKLKNLHPFGRVPIFQHGDFQIYETAAILQYIERLWSAEMDLSAKNIARVSQVASIIDHYGYIPLVRQVYSHGVYRVAQNVPYDEAEINAGLAAAKPVLAELEAIAKEGQVLNGQSWGRADWHLAPMIDAFQMFSEGHRLLIEHKALFNWYKSIAERKSFITTAIKLENHKTEEII